MNFSEKVIIASCIVAFCLTALGLVLTVAWANKKIKEEKDLLNEVYEANKNRIDNLPLSDVVDEANASFGITKDPASK